MKKYGVICPDPPWAYDRAGAITRYKGCRKARANAHYPTMTVAEMAALRPLIDSWAAPDCAMPVWCTGPKLPEMMMLLGAWGFQFKTKLLCWVKLARRDVDPKQLRLMGDSWERDVRKGLGFYSRGNTEDCWLWVRGKPKLPEDRNVGQVVFAPIREHSRKPDEAYDRIARLWPDCNRLEMFARTSRPGWESWGNEATKFDQVEDAPAVEEGGHLPGQLLLVQR